ncbi:hypothetical protein OQA88_4857 [Cercophora sp. LCS_1]
MKIVSLPNEMLHDIARQLSPRWTEAYLAKENNSSLEATAKSRRDDLVALIKVNRKFRHIATEHLYRSIRITDNVSLGMLARTLVKKESRGAMVRHLHLTNTHFGVAGENDARIVMALLKTVQKKYPKVDSAIRRHLAQGAAVDPNALRPHTAALACALVLCLSPGLRVWRVDKQQESNEPWDLCWRICRSFADEPPEPASADEPKPPKPFGSIKSLLTQGHPEFFNLVEIFVPGSLANVTLTMGGFRGIEQVETGFDRNPGRWKDLTGLRLLDAHISGDWFYSMCKKEFKSLESIDIRADCPSVVVHEGAPPEMRVDPGFNDAFALRAGTLKSLRFTPCRNRLSWKVYLGADQRLSCLPSLVHVTHLHVPLTALFALPEEIEEMSLCDLLPPNVEYVDIDAQFDCNWYIWEHIVLNPYDEMPAPSFLDQCSGEHQRLVRAKVSQLAEHCAAKLPRLMQAAFVVDNLPDVFMPNQWPGRKWPEGLWVEPAKPEDKKGFIYLLPPHSIELREGKRKEVRAAIKDSSPEGW